MPVLSNPKHERFAQELAKGKSQTDAYREAAGKDNRRYASELGQRPDITGRVSELLAGRERVETKATEKAIERLAIDKEWVLSRLVENVERAMQAKAVLDSEGKSAGEYKYEGSVANRALELVGKELGMFVERTENVNVNHDVSDKPLTEDEWVAEAPTAH